MLAHEYETMRQVEDTYWWYQVLRGAVVREVIRLLKGRRQARIVDAGCGTGGMLARLQGADSTWQLGGVDLSPRAVAHARSRGFTGVVEGDVARLPFPDGETDGVVSLDVLYHAKVDERAASREFHRVLRPGGFLVSNLPAFDALTGSHDRAVSGARRYTKARVRRLLEEAGFVIERQHYWNAWLFPLILPWRVMSRLRSPSASCETSSDLSPLPLWINTALSAIGRLDFGLCRALGVPFGTSVFTVARKPAP